MGKGDGARGKGRRGGKSVWEGQRKEGRDGRERRVGREGNEKGKGRVVEGKSRPHGHF